VGGGGGGGGGGVMGVVVEKTKLRLLSLGARALFRTYEVQARMEVCML